VSGDPLTRLTAIAVPLLRDNINTDVIIPSREMKSVTRSGLAEGLFADWRYTQVGGRTPEAGFVLNDPRYAGARILLAGANFGCGSSREHAAWALREFGFRVIVASGFNPIFRNNAFLNGIAPIVLAQDLINALAAEVAEDPESRLVRIDIVDMTIRFPSGRIERFDLEATARALLLGGLDMIDLTLQHRDAISAFRARDAVARPWSY
jgi:3-isopropylmalate/(R)-2-methylmalate dehydratase small subunit